MMQGTRVSKAKALIKRKGKRARQREKEKEEYLYSAILVCHTHKDLRHGSHSSTCKLRHASAFPS